MRAALYRHESGVNRARPPACNVRSIRWWQDIPPPIRSLGVVPVRFDVSQDYELAADRTQGYDGRHEPCYCAFRYVVTQLRSDDDELFYEAPVHAEMLTSWRLLDQRWLVCRTTVQNFDRGECQTSLSLSNAMPR